MRRSWFGSPLAFRIIIGLTLFSSVVTVVLTALQLYTEFDRDVGHLEQRIAEIKQGYASGLVTSLWRNDETMVQRQLQGILSLPDIIYLEIRDRDGAVVSVGDRKSERITAHRVSLLYNDQGTARDVGTLTLIATLDGVYQSLFDRVWIILASNAAKTVIVCGFLFFLVQYTVTRHLTRIANHLMALVPVGQIAALRLDRKDGRRDELNTVVEAVNEMQHRLRESQDALRSREAALKSNVAQLKEAKTALEQRSRALERLASDYDDARARAESSSRSKTEFLANMSHELRTPLNAIVGFGEIIAREMFGSLNNDKYRMYANDIIKSSTHLLSIVNDMLDLSQIEAGKTRLVEEIVDIHEAVGDALEFLRPDLIANNVRFVDRIDDDVPTLRADRRVLRQILLNLLSNAIKFTPPEGRLTVRAGRDEAGRVAIAVEDTGEGIPQTEIETILKPFGLAESNLRRDHEGTGLGLPLCKALMELHGGSLKITSEVGYGTTVTLRFPAERVERELSVTHGT